MSRISASSRKEVARFLTDTYAFNILSPLSGVVCVKSLAFSPYPRCWSIIAETKVDRDYLTCDIEITATVSRQWLNDRFDGLLHWPSQQQPNRISLLAGNQPLTPPPGLDGLHLISYADHPPASRSILRLTPRWGFRFYANGIFCICGITTEFPTRMDRAIAAAYQEFRQHLANRVARRLNPQPPDMGKPVEK
jgi:hypothetical protein